ncbi:nucleotide exchange factor GrpE [Buchnera aphidicola (Thelaxes californica)]|uniref:Protein GrpE n=1 Tax=Buchnera aphidicola (Thelaxes californica) TaxID=1315998 RepID=A0A4D6YL82_9GAMM|nr:nucleotide exchange factor GrpE [Buchnera aphidicola]QCI26730.1 nucleotide exchange factor GrpE [Buchnera aphidicola (Thelaxes californica)]
MSIKKKNYENNMYYDVFQKKKNELNDNNMIKLKKKILDYQKQIINLKEIEKKRINKILERENILLQSTYKYSLEKIIISLLTTIDSLEQAISLTKKNFDNDQSIISEMNVILKEIHNILHEYHVNIINESNVIFNPSIHQAMLMQHSDEIPENHIIMVVQKGYILHDRLLRAALVIVSSGKS